MKIAIDLRDQTALDHVRRRAKECGCRLEVSSDDGEMPVSASNNARTAYGFGKTIAEAVENLRSNPRRI